MSLSLDWWNVVVNTTQVVGTVGGLLLVWWKVRQIREVNAYELLRDEVKRFNSPEMRACRARLARTLLASRRDFDKIEEEGGEEVTGYFEDIGLLLRRRIVPAYFLWSMLADDVFNYWQALRDYLVWVRRTTRNETYYEDFDLLRNCLAALEKKRTGVEALRPDTELREFLEDETKLAAGAEAPKRPGRRLGVACPHCRHPVAIRAADLARTLKCPGCGGSFTLKQPSI
jgi:hypothetical protein